MQLSFHGRRLLVREIKEQLAPLDLLTDLEGLVALVVKIDNRLYAREMERRQAKRRSPEPQELPSSSRRPDL